MLKLDDHAALLNLRIVEGFVERVDRAAGDFGSAELIEPVVGVVLKEEWFEDGR